MSEDFRELPWLLLLAYGSKLPKRIVNNILRIWCQQNGWALHEFFVASPQTWEAVLQLDKKTIMKIEQANEKILEYILLAEQLVHSSTRLLTVIDECYPQQLKVTIENNELPPLICALGDINILQRINVAMIGSRSADQTSLIFTQHVARFLARRGVNIISGNAYGVDRNAFVGAMFADGYATIVLPHGIRKLNAVQMRELLPKIKAGKVLVLSQFHPDDNWLVSRAMERNKVITGLAEIVIVAESNTTGGTWNGAIGAMKQMRPLYVQLNSDIIHPGNNMLIFQGGLPLPWPTDDLENFFSPLFSPPVQNTR